MKSGLPESAVVYQQLPKKAVYEKFDLTGQEKSRFDQSIHKCRMLVLSLFDRCFSAIIYYHSRSFGTLW